MTHAQNTIDMLLDLEYSPSYSTLVEDRDHDTTSYWFEVNFETSANDQEQGIQIIQVIVTPEVFERYKEHFPLPHQDNFIVQNDQFPRLVDRPFGL